MSLALLYSSYPLLRLTPIKYGRLTLESAGMTLGVMAVWAVIVAEEEELPWLRLLAVLSLIGSGVTHGIAFTMALLAMAVVVFARLLARKLTWVGLGRDVLLYAVIPVLVVVTGVLIGRGVEIGSGITNAGAYELVNGTGDPTAALNIVLSTGGSIFDAPPPQPDPAPGWYVYFERFYAESIAPNTFLASYVDGHPLRTVGWIGLIGLVGMFIPGRHRAAFISLGVGSVGIYLLALYFANSYDLWIYLQHPIRREFKYTMIPVLLLLIFLAATPLARKMLASMRSRWLALLLVTALVGWGYWQTVTTIDQWSRPVLEANELAALDWIATNTEADDTVLANVRTVAVFELYADRVSVTEGGVPYLFPELLTTVLGILDTGQSFFQSPTLDTAEELGADYILTVGQSGARSGLRLTGNIYSWVDVEGLDTAEFLKLEAVFDDIRIYSVERT